MGPEEATRELEKLLDPGPEPSPDDWENREEAERLFAITRGWIVAHKPFRVGQLLRGSNQTTRIEDYEAYGPPEINGVFFDHPEWYRFDEKPYRPAGIVIHSYGLKREVDVEIFRGQVAKGGLQMELLPKSWYYCHTTAVVLTPLYSCYENYVRAMVGASTNKKDRVSVN